MTNLTITLDSLILGFILGVAVMSIALWLTERDINKDDRWHVGFSKGWDSGYKYGKTGTGKEADNG